MSLRICVGGATGWTGKALVAGVAAAADLALAGAVARKAAGKDAGTVAGIDPLGIAVSPSVEDALKATPSDVYIDYTHPSAVKANVLKALELGVPAVIGTSGLAAADYVEIAKAADSQGLGVVASGNFSITASLLTRFSLLAASHVPDYEIIDYAKSTKPDTPSGTARELAERMGIGYWIWDRDGRQYLDLLAGMGVANIGHAHPQVVRAIEAQARDYLHVSVYGEMIQAPQVELARRLTEVAPGNLSVAYFTNSGAEAIEGALKTARKFTDRPRFIAFEGAFHGDTFGALSIGGNPLYQHPFEPLLPQPGVDHHGPLSTPAQNHQQRPPAAAGGGTSGLPAFHRVRRGPRDNESPSRSGARAAAPARRARLPQLSKRQMVARQLRPRRLHPRHDKGPSPRRCRS